MCLLYAWARDSSCAFHSAIRCRAGAVVCTAEEDSAVTTTMRGAKRTLQRYYKQGRGRLSILNPICLPAHSLDASPNEQGGNKRRDTLRLRSGQAPRALRTFAAQRWLTAVWECDIGTSRRPCYHEGSRRWCTGVRSTSDQDTPFPRSPGSTRGIPLRRRPFPRSIAHPAEPPRLPHPRAQGGNV
jgi:hypothetical protein